MRYSRLIFAVPLLFALSAHSWAEQDYQIQPGWSQIQFCVKNFAVHTVRGRFTSFTGSIHYDGADILQSKVSVTIQAASVDTKVKKRDAHLRTVDFFDVEKTPEITFHSERIRKSREIYILTGPLTIKGHTKEVDLPFIFSLDTSTPEKPVLHAQTDLTINRHDFGIDYGSNFSIAKKVKISIHIQASPQ